MSLRRVRPGNDRGAALITVIGIAAVVTVLAAVSVTLAVNNLRNATRDKESNSALATSEAGIAEAVEALRAGAVSLAQLTCMQTAPAAVPTGNCSYAWANPTNPMQVAVDGSVGSCDPTRTCYSVWIGTKQRYAPPLTKEGIFYIHSKGTYGNGPAARRVIAQVRLRPYPFPIGVFAEELDGGGNAGIRYESLFTLDCVGQRGDDTKNGGGLRFSGIDKMYGIPAAAHSADYISSDNSCSASKNIHSAGPCADSMNAFYDQSGVGGLLAGTACNERPYEGVVYKDPLDPSKNYPSTSSFDKTMLQGYGYRPRGLSDSVYQVLKTRAVAAGTYCTEANDCAGRSIQAALDAQAGGMAVLYVDVPSGTKVTLSKNDIPSAYLREENNGGGASCTPSRLVIVVQGGDLTLNSIGVGNSPPVTGLVASIFVPDGHYDGQGNIWVIGTIWAADMNLSGTQDLRLDQCFVENPPSPMLDVDVQRFLEDDGSDVN